MITTQQARNDRTLLPGGYEVGTANIGRASILAPGRQHDHDS